MVSSELNHKFHFSPGWHVTDAFSKSLLGNILSFELLFPPREVDHAWKKCNTRAIRGEGEASFQPLSKAQKYI